MPGCFKSLPDRVCRSGLACISRVSDYEYVEPDTGIISGSRPGISQASAQYHGELCILKRYELSNDTAIAGLCAELDILSSLQNQCSFLAPIEAVWCEDGAIYVHRTWIQGFPLCEWLKISPEPYQIRYVFRRVLAALDLMATYGFTHGNLSDKNIIIREPDVNFRSGYGRSHGIVLVDFNASGRFYESFPNLSLPHTPAATITPTLAPEVVSGQAGLSAASDIW